MCVSRQPCDHVLVGQDETIAEKRGPPITGVVKPQRERVFDPSVTGANERAGWRRHELHEPPHDIWFVAMSVKHRLRAFFQQRRQGPDCR